MRFWNNGIKNSWRWELVSELLTPDWLARIAAADRLIIAYSGGLDSTVLLHRIAQLSRPSQSILVVHINHGLSAFASQWEAHCCTVCHDLGLPWHLERVCLDGCNNLEENARKARYARLQALMRAGDLLLLGHHQDDQAETLLLQLIRGAGVDGLSGMPMIKPFGAGHLGRPFLSCSRAQLEAWATHHQLQWIEDDSNTDRHFSRNFLRHDVMPLLRSRWPAVSGNLARSAGHCQQAQGLLEALAVMDEPAIHATSLPMARLTGLSDARRLNVLRAWLKRHVHPLPDSATFGRILLEVVQASCDANPLVCWGAYAVRRYRNDLYVMPAHRFTMPPCAQIWSEFPEPLVLQQGLGVVRARLCEQGLLLPENARLTIAYRQGGESLRWHGQTKSLKKLMQDWHIPTWMRGHTPLLLVNGELAAVPGFAVDDRFFSREKGYEIVWDDGSTGSPSS